MKRLLFSSVMVALIAGQVQAASIKVLLVDGQNNHKWQETTPILVDYLKKAGLFEVDVATSPPKGEDMSSFRPKFAGYDVVVSNYNGAPWSDQAQDDFEKFVRKGGGFVSVHAANNAFPNWKVYNQMIGIGGWGGRNEKSGPYVRYWEGKIIKDISPGRGGSHGRQHAFQIEARDPEHPIMKGLPEKWMHAQDELYDRLRGPASKLHVLATAYSSKDTGGSGFNEPMLMTIEHGAGRVFHTTLGHYLPAMKCVGFQTTFLRGVEWAATGQVTQPVPANFPTAENVSSN